MKGLKTLVIGIIIGVLVGLWFGVNIGKEKSLFSNPFEEDSIQQKLKNSGSKILEKSGEAIEKSGKALKETMQKPAPE